MFTISKKSNSMCLHTNIQNYKSLVCVYFSHGEGASRICYFSQNGALKCMSTDFNGKTNKPLEHKGQKKKSIHSEMEKKVYV